MHFPYLVRCDALLRRALCVALIVLTSFANAKAQRTVPPTREAAQYSFAPIVKRVAPAVVNVYVRSTRQTVQSPMFRDPFFREFFGRGFGTPGRREQNSLGSGVIVHRAGFIVTNTHVIKSSGRAEIRVVLSDQREYRAVVVQQDAQTDIAVLKIKDGSSNFPIIEFADSDALQVGDLVLAIGNPFGVGQTVTSGIVSALARSGLTQAEAQVFIQTDAAINPGNSGGALVNMAGRLVGINTAIFSKTGGSHGIGFAIPANLVRLYVQSAISGRRLERPWLGARLESVTREIAENLRLKRVAGAVVVRLNNRGPAARAGLRAGDVIVAVDGRNVADARAARYRMTTRGAGKRVALDVIRQGRRVTVDVRLTAAPEPGPDDVRDLSGVHPLAGAQVANVFPSIAEALKIDIDEGVVVVGVKRRSPASRLGLRPGDVIVDIGRKSIKTISDLEAALRRPRRVWYLAVRRGQRVWRLEVPT